METSKPQYKGAKSKAALTGKEEKEEVEREIILRKSKSYFILIGRRKEAN